MISSAIRSAFLSYFRGYNHAPVASSPLVPAQDHSLLFTNSGMVQFKDIFLGIEPSNHARAVTIQRCLRAGGKHNDLENVGYTARHHTFFEMMGNFSFTDYFKEEAIAYAWDFVTKVLKLPEEKLWVTVHLSDTQAEQIWLQKIGVSAERFSRLDNDNFWSMGNTGPCGPCSEIFYDHGPKVKGGPPGSPDEDGDRYVEIWNLVFMQYERDDSGELTALEKPSVDTGMGLERIAAVMQGKVSNYDTDLFNPLIAKAAELLSCDDIDNPSLKVIADHIRACAFLIYDGVLPGNEGRGYVLRRIIRRAIRHGYSLGARDIFFSQLLGQVVQTMDNYQQELSAREERIRKVLDNEETQFHNTLEQGMSLLDGYLKNMSGKVIDGETVFRLYDTFGFPVDLTNDIAREQGLSIDNKGFEKYMQQQQKQSKQSHSFHTTDVQLPTLNHVNAFSGYSKSVAQTEVELVVIDNATVSALDEGSTGWILLKETPFYAESGGQIGDNGIICSAAGRARVENTIKKGENHWHLVTIEQGSIQPGDAVTASIDEERRHAIMRNHSATHLLHAALRLELGDSVMQRGSLVTQDKLRFDFSHNESIEPGQLQQIEKIVNQQILQNTEVVVQTMTMDDAKKAGAIAFFEEKYGERVRVLSMGKLHGETYSRELCGGTHVARTGDIGSFHIVSESGIASGVRRIEALTGENVQNWITQLEQTVNKSAHALKTDSSSLVQVLTNLVEQNKKLDKEIHQLQAKLASGASASQAIDIAGVATVIRRLDNIAPSAMRSAIDSHKSSLGTGAILIVGEFQGKVSMIAGVTNNLTKTVSAVDWLRSLAKYVEGKAGGRADMAQGGGNAPEGIDAMLKNAPEHLKDIINQS